MKLIILFILIFAFSAFGQAVKPTPSPSQTETIKFELTKEESDVLSRLEVNQSLMRLCGVVPGGELDCKKIENNVAETYSQAVRYPKLVNLLLTRAAIKYESIRDSAKGAPQVSQVADEHNVVLNRLIVAQNQRIIELLEQLVKKK